MTEKAQAANAWISDHLWKIVAALLVFYGTYSAGQATMESRVDAMESRLARIEGRLSQRFGFMNDATGPVNYLCEKDDGCRERFDPVRVPE
jgi:hypothetical protein